MSGNPAVNANSFFGVNVRQAPLPWDGPPLPQASQTSHDFVGGLMRRKASSDGGALGVTPPDWYRAGAYTNPPPAFADEATKALQAIAKAVSARDEASAQDRGKLAAVGKTEERCLFMIRGCDSLTVPLGTATVGKELFHALRTTASQDRPLLRSIKFPVNVTNRFAFGMCSLNIGGKGQIPEYALTVGDFPSTSEADFDGYAIPGDIKLEKKPRAPATLTLWFRNALRQSWAVACVFGVQHYGCWERAANGLLRLGEESAHAWPLHLVIATWEELWSRFLEEIKDTKRKARREMGEDYPRSRGSSFSAPPRAWMAKRSNSRILWNISRLMSCLGSVVSLRGLAGAWLLRVLTAS